MRGALMVMSVLGLALLAGGCGAPASPPDDAVAVDLDALAATVSAQSSAKGSSRVTFELTGSATPAFGEGGHRTAPDLAADFSVTDQEGPIRFVLLGGIFYLRLPEARRARLGIGTPWVRFTAAERDAASRPYTHLAESMIAQADIGRQVGKLRAAGRIATTTGERVDGQVTTRYSIDVDVARLTEAEPNPVLRANLQALARRGTRSLAYQLWVDGQGLPVKSVTDVPDPNGQPSTVTMHFAEWGEPVAVAAPPAEEVGEAPEPSG